MFIGKETKAPLDASIELSQFLSLILFFCGKTSLFALIDETKYNRPAII